jgi:hypothetical protein
MNIYKKNVFVVDYRQRMIEYSPFVHIIRFVLQDINDEMVAKLFFDQNTADKMRWIISYLTACHKNAEINYYEVASALNMSINFFAKNFPVRDFAKDFKLQRIIDKKIREMDVLVTSFIDIDEINDERFFYWLNQTEAECNLSINSLNPKNLTPIEEDIVSLPATVAPIGITI